MVDFDGNVWSFGCNTNGQLSLGHCGKINIPTQIPSIKEINQISQGTESYHILLKNSRNEIFVVGNNDYGQIALKCFFKTTTTPVQIDSSLSMIWGSEINSIAKSARK